MNTLQKIRWALGLFIAGLVLSGITAFPLRSELGWLTKVRGAESAADAVTGFDRWIAIVRHGLSDTYAKYPWMGYGTDWLAFAHLIIALFFIAPWKDPLRNIAAIRAGIAACILVIPLALICGEIRQIPFGWRLIDCSFGILGVLPLLYALNLAKRMEQART
jgi:hypothetical protein